MKQVIQQRVTENLARVRNLVAIYSTHLAGAGRGRRGAHQTDVLRSTVVLLHATLEDFLRSLAYWKLPAAGKVVLDDIALVGLGPNPKKFFLGELDAHRGKLVEQLIAESVNEHLERSNYNNTQEVASLLQAIGINVPAVNNSFQALDQAMARRHQVVHRADRDETPGRGNHNVRSIGTTQVTTWIDAVEQFTTDVLAQV